MKTRFLIIPIVAVLCSTGLAKDKHPDPPSAEINFVILKEYNGKPLRNAAVVLHSVNGKEEQEKGGLELKTNADGKASYEGIPYGKLRVQVLANGFQTFGEDYDINQPTHEFTIKMKRPAGQYSIYEDHPADQSKDKKDGAPDSTQPQP